MQKARRPALAALSARFIEPFDFGFQNINQDLNALSISPPQSKNEKTNRQRRRWPQGPVSTPFIG
jgi:hypothetical protein